MNSPPLPVLLESILFFKGGAVKRTELAAAAHVSAHDVEGALIELKTELEGRGVRLILDGDSVALATAPESETAIAEMRRAELEGPVGRAGLETLAVIIYRGPVSRADIEYIRGVNVSSMLRSLLIRGLIERIDNPKDKRSFLYRTTVDLPAYLGVSSVEELPGFAGVRADIEKVFAERSVVEAEAPQSEA